VYLQKLGYFPLGLCPKLRTQKNYLRQVERVVNKTCRRRRRRSSLLLTTPRRGVYYKSVNCNPLTLLLRFAADLSYNLFLQLTRFRVT